MPYETMPASPDPTKGIATKRVGTAIFGRTEIVLGGAVRDIGVGPTTYTGATATGVFCEAGIFDYAMTDLEIQAVYLRTRARLALRPTPVVVV